MSLSLPNSLWTATASPEPDCYPLLGDTQTDVAIVGAGFTGLRAALELSQQGVNVTVVDAGQIGWGASGRNGGQVSPIGHESPEDILKKWAQRYGADIASPLVERYAAMTMNAADELFELVKQYDIDCDTEQNGWIRAVHGPSAEATFMHQYQGWHNAGADVSLLDAGQVEAMSGCRGYGIGMIANRAGTVQPMSYVRGLAKAAMQAGAAIHCDTAIERLEQHNGQWKLSALTGSILADQVLLCTNGYTDPLYPDLAKTIVPVISMQAATQVLTEAQSAEILPGRQNRRNSRSFTPYPPACARSTHWLRL